MALLEANSVLISDGDNSYKTYLFIHFKMTSVKYLYTCLLVEKKLSYSQSLGEVTML